MKMINYYENENSRDVGNLYYDKGTLMKVRGMFWILKVQLRFISLPVFSYS